MSTGKAANFPLNYKNIVLRPMLERDLVDEERWNTVETEWGEWDAPWESDEPFDIKKEREKLRKEMSNPPKVYSTLELDTDEGWHIGGVNRYFIDGDRELVAVGITIPPIEARRKGYGKNALVLWISYQFCHSDVEEIYTQTWSGNYPMVKLAKSIGFEEIGRIKGIRKVRGERYDDLTFSLSRKEFYERYNDIEFGREMFEMNLVELWDVLDENGNATGRVHERGRPMREGEHHLEVCVWIENDNGEYLISQRSRNKAFPHMWECTGGSAVAGDDSLATALKEVKEELGIVLEPQNGRMIRHHLRCGNTECSGLVDVWLFRHNIDISTIVLAPDETRDAKWASRGEINRMINEGTFKTFNYIDELLG